MSVFVVQPDHGCEGKGEAVHVSTTKKSAELFIEIASRSSYYNYVITELPLQCLTLEEKKVSPEVIMEGRL